MAQYGKAWPSSGRLGQTLPGRTRPGSAWPGSARLATTRIGSAPFSKAWPSPAWLGSTQQGPAQGVALYAHALGSVVGESKAGLSDSAVSVGMVRNVICNIKACHSDNRSMVLNGLQSKCAAKALRHAMDRSFDDVLADKRHHNTQTFTALRFDLEQQLRRAIDSGKADALPEAVALYGTSGTGGKGLRDAVCIECGQKQLERLSMCVTLTSLA